MSTPPTLLMGYGTLYFGATTRPRDPCAASMRPNVNLRWPFVFFLSVSLFSIVVIAFFIRVMLTELN